MLAVPRRPIAVDLKHPLFVTYSPNMVRSTLRGARAVEVMADDFRVFSASVSAVTEDHMELAGWTRTQIATHGAEARRVAQREAERKLS